MVKVSSSIQQRPGIMVQRMVDIFMGLGSFKLMLDAAKNLKNISDPDVRNDAVVALQEQIVAAQESYSALLENVRTLEAEARHLETWESEKERYELRKVTEHSKILAYTLKESEQGAEPPHWICPDCYSWAKKSLLQYAVRTPGRAEVLACQSCGWAGYLSGLWYPEHGGARPLSRPAR